MLGLTDQVGGDVFGIGAVVGQYHDLSGSGLSVDANQALQQALGCCDIDVARTGDQVDRFAHHSAGVRGAVYTGFACAVRKHCDRLSPSDGVHLIDTQQLARSQDGRVGVAGEHFCVVFLRRAGDRD